MDPEPKESLLSEQLKTEIKYYVAKESAAPYDELAAPYDVSAALHGVLALQDTHGTSRGA